MNGKARWVWAGTEQTDEYCSFRQKFVCSGEKIILKLCAVTNYVAFVNGKRVGNGIFAGYPNEKYFDRIDVSPYCKAGENELTVTVWNEGLNSSTHIAERGGLIFCIEEDGKAIAVSGESFTQGGLCGEYVQHEKHLITMQLGYTSGMINGSDTKYGRCIEVDLTYNIKPRPVKRLIEGDFLSASPICVKGRQIFDLGRETVGHLVLDCESESDCKVKIAYGEHIVDGKVRYLIEGRDFSLDFYCKSGENKFEQHFVRVACRYLEIFSESEIQIKRIGLIPVTYPQEEIPNFLTGIDKDIYDVCQRTLTLCMHEHYEDCPWREQALYVLDARNQMLCGYYAFKEHSFQRANLVFMTKGTREDGLLELTYPAVNTPAIPFFSVMYPVAVFEYVEHTGDISILDEVMPTALKIMSFFKAKIDDNGLIATLPAPYWNFYEWAEGSDGQSFYRENQYDLILNCAFVYSFERFKGLCDMHGIELDVDIDAIKKSIQATFYSKETGMYFLSSVGERRYSQLGNAFAMLIGLGGEGVVGAVRGEGVIPATLSMIGYVYDALLMHGANGQFILDDIRSKYTMMLQQGATSVWETVLGEADFDGAGSLCHGWSAMPIYYYNKLMRR